MPKIKINILTKERMVKHLEKSLNADGVIYKNGFYSVEKEAINVTFKPTAMLNPSPELFYVESDPVPLMHKPTLTPLQFLDRLIAINLLEQATGGKSGQMFAGLRNIVSSAMDQGPKLILFLIIAFVALMFVLNGGHI